MKKLFGFFAMSRMSRLAGLVGVAGLALSAAMMTTQAAAPKAQTTSPKRIQVTGEIIDTWCYVTEIMYAEGTAHHQCAVWCALGGIPVSIKAKDGTVYMVLRIEGDDTSVANPKIVKIQSREVTVDGDHYVRDGVNYLIVNKVANDNGIVNMTHDEYGVVPFGE